MADKIQDEEDSSHSTYSSDCVANAFEVRVAEVRVAIRFCAHIVRVCNKRKQSRPGTHGAGQLEGKKEGGRTGRDEDSLSEFKLLRIEPDRQS